MMDIGPGLYYQADEAFTHAHRRAFVQRALAILLRHHPAELLSFDTVRARLKVRGQYFRGLQLVPMDKIVGSVGRFQEFNRAFLPLKEHIRERWKGIYAAAQTQGLPPVDLYQIGDAYFVRDGHHRISVFKELGATQVEAYVTEFDSPVPLLSDAADGDLDLKEEYAAFLEKTGLHLLRPQQRVEFSLPCQYRTLLEHIAVHRYFLGQREGRDIAYDEAVASWYDEVYEPLCQVIRETSVLAMFPGRTEADLYLWLSEHRLYLSQEYGTIVSYREAAADFTRIQPEPRSRAVARRLRRKRPKVNT